MNEVSNFVENVWNTAVDNVGLIIFCVIVVLCALYMFSSNKKAKKAAEEAKKKAEAEKKKHDHAKKDSDHPDHKKEHDDKNHKDHDHGKPQGFVAGVLALGFGCLAIWGVIKLVNHVGVPLLDYSVDKVLGPERLKFTSSTDPPKTTLVRPPADTTATIQLVAGKESKPVTTKTWWYDGHMLDGTVTDFRIVYPDQSERTYRDVSETRLPEGLHIPPGSKIYYTSKRAGKIFIAHF